MPPLFFYYLYAVIDIQKTVCRPYCACVGNKPQKHFSNVFWNSICTILFVMSVENIILFHFVLDEALERLGKKNLKLKECQYEAVKAVVVDRKDKICILPIGHGKSIIYPSSILRLIESIYLQRMRSTGDIHFFVCRSRIIPEPPFPSQGIAGSGNEIDKLYKITSKLLLMYSFFYIIIRVHSAFSLVASCVLSKYTRTDDVN